MLLKEFMKDNVDSYYPSHQLEYSLLCNYIKLVLLGVWHGNEYINANLAENAFMTDYFTPLPYTPKDNPLTVPQFGDLIEVLRGDVHFYAIYGWYGDGYFTDWASNYTSEEPVKRWLYQPNYTTSDKEVTTQNLFTRFDKWVEEGYEVTVWRPIVTDNLFEGHRVGLDEFDPDVESDPRDPLDYPNMELFRWEVRERRSKDVDNFEYADNGETGGDLTITSSDGTEHKTTVPYADAETNGLMTKEKFQQVDNNTTRIQSLETGGLFRGSFDVLPNVPVITPDSAFVGGEVGNNDFVIVRHYPFAEGQYIGLPTGITFGDTTIDVYGNLPVQSGTQLAYFVIADNQWYYPDSSGNYQAQGSGLSSSTSKFIAMTEADPLVPGEYDITWTFQSQVDEDIPYATQLIAGILKFDGVTLNLNSNGQLVWTDNLNIQQRLLNIEAAIYNWSADKNTKIPRGNINHNTDPTYGIFTHDGAISQDVFEV